MQRAGRDLTIRRFRRYIYSDLMQKYVNEKDKKIREQGIHVSEKIEYSQMSVQGT